VLHARFLPSPRKFLLLIQGLMVMCAINIVDFENPWVETCGVRGGDGRMGACILFNKKSD
jgi:hypothetical protein